MLFGNGIVVTPHSLSFRMYQMLFKQMHARTFLQCLLVNSSHEEPVFRLKGPKKVELKSNRTIQSHPTVPDSSWWYYRLNNYEKEWGITGVSPQTLQPALGLTCPSPLNCTGMTCHCALYHSSATAESTTQVWTGGKKPHRYPQAVQGSMETWR